MTSSPLVRYTDFTPESFSEALRREVENETAVGAWITARGGKRNLGVRDRLLLVALKTRQIWSALPLDGRPEFETYLAHSVWAWRDKKVSDYLAYRELRRIFPRPHVLHLRAPAKIWQPDKVFHPPRRSRFKKTDPIFVSTPHGSIHQLTGGKKQSTLS